MPKLLKGFSIVHIISLLIVMMPIHESGGIFLNNISPKEGVFVSNIGDYEKIISGLDIFEYADGMFSDNEIYLLYNVSNQESSWDNVIVPLPPNWNAYMLGSSVYELVENRSWVKDYGFEASGNWTAGDFHKKPSDNWTVGNEIGDGISGRGLYFKLDNSDQLLGALIDKHDSIWFLQNVTGIIGDELVWAGLSFDYKVNLIGNMASVPISIFVASNETNPGERTLDYWDCNASGCPSLMMMQNYDIIIWDCGYSDGSMMYGASLNGTERALITEFLNAGGNLLLMGNGIAYDAASNGWENSWLRPTFNATYSSYNSNPTELEGVQNSLYENISNVTYSAGFYDELNVEIGGVEVMEYQNGNVMAVYSKNAFSQKIFMGGSLAHVDNLNQRAEILNVTFNNFTQSANSILYIHDYKSSYASNYQIMDAIESLGFSTPLYKNDLIKVPFWTIESENTWYNTGMVPIQIEKLSLPDFNIQIGLKYENCLLLKPDPLPEVWIDNLKLYMITKVKPSEVTLKMNNVDVSDGITNGEGYISQWKDPLWSGTTDIIANFTCTPIPDLSTTDLDASISFMTDLNLFINKTCKTVYPFDPNAKGMKFSVNKNSSWEFYYPVTLPNGYNTHKLNLSIPDDWTITFIAEPQRPSLNLKGNANITGGSLGDGFIEITTTMITNSPNGLWIFKAISPNYVKNITFWNSVDWIEVNGDELKPGDLIVIRANIMDNTGFPPSEIASTIANLLIFDPNGVVWHNSTAVPWSNGTVEFQSVEIMGSTMVSGVYTIQVNWNNDNETGSQSSTFSVQISSKSSPAISLPLAIIIASLVIASAIIIYGYLRRPKQAKAPITTPKKS